MAGKGKKEKGAQSRRRSDVRVRGGLRRDAGARQKRGKKREGKKSGRLRSGPGEAKGERKRRAMPCGGAKESRAPCVGEKKEGEDSRSTPPFLMDVSSACVRRERERGESAEPCLAEHFCSCCSSPTTGKGGKRRGEGKGGVWGVGSAFPSTIRRVTPMEREKGKEGHDRRCAFFR